MPMWMGKSESFLVTLMSKNKKSFLASLKERLFLVLKTYFSKEKILSYLEKEVVKAVLKKLIISGGIRVWIITFVIHELFEKGDEYIIEPIMRKFGYVVDSLNGTKIYRRIKDAQNIDDWRAAVRNS